MRSLSSNLRAPRVFPVFAVRDFGCCDAMLSSRHAVSRAGMT